MNTLSDLQSIYDAGVITNDRGNGCGGPGFIAEDDARGDETQIVFVTRDEDPQAWELATDAASVLGLPLPTYVGIGEASHPGEFLESNPHQMIYSV